MRETNTPPKTAQVSLGFSLLESPVRRSHYIYTHISLISKDAPIHTETQLLVKPPQYFRGLTDSHQHSGPAGCCRDSIRHMLCLLPAQLPGGAPLYFTEVVNFGATFRSRACGSLKLSPNFCALPWLPPPYLLCLPLTHLQHPPSHYCFRTQRLLPFPKKSMHIKHFILFLPPFFPPSMIPSFPPVDLTICMIGQKARIQKES